MQQTYKILIKNVPRFRPEQNYQRSAEEFCRWSPPEVLGFPDRAPRGEAWGPESPRAVVRVRVPKTAAWTPSNRTTPRRTWWALASSRAKTISQYCEKSRTLRSASARTRVCWVFREYVSIGIQNLDTGLLGVNIFFGLLLSYIFLIVWNDERAKRTAKDAHWW